MDNDYKENKTHDVPTWGTDGVGIRATLNNMGIPNRSIGFNDADGTVTLNGKTLMKPKYYDDRNGITYSPKGDIQKSLVNYYKDSSNPIVRVSDAYAAAAGEYGLSSDALSYGNGTVMIGGKPINTLYIDDSGKAWAWKNDVDAVTADYVKSSGAQTPDSILDTYTRRYLSDINSKLYDVLDRKDFSYNPDTDPVYNAYKEMYMREGSRAAQDTMAGYSALTGGYVNSAAVTAGGLANQYYAQQLTDKIPELAAEAYKRYLDSYNMDLDAADKLLDTYNAAYTDAVAANEKTRRNINDSAKSVVDRDNAAYERNAANEQAEFERYWANLLNGQKYDTQERENEWAEIFNTQKRTQNTYKNTGYMLDNKEHEMYLGYYDRLLAAKLEGENLSNQKIRAEIRAKYGY